MANDRWDEEAARLVVPCGHFSDEYQRQHPDMICTWCEQDRVPIAAALRAAYEAGRADARLAFTFGVDTRSRADR